MSGASLIAKERSRQVKDKKWTAAHDDDHADESLAQAAQRLINDILIGRIGYSNCGADDEELEQMPWPEILARHCIQKHPIRRLVIAGALIAAEIDRRNRKIRKEKKHA